MSWADFIWAFKIEYLSAFVLYVKVQEFIHPRQGNIIVREFSTKINSLTKYAPEVTSIDKGKLVVFLWGFK